MGAMACSGCGTAAATVDSAATIGLTAVAAALFATPCGLLCAAVPPLIATISLFHRFSRRSCSSCAANARCSSERLNALTEAEEAADAVAPTAAVPLSGSGAERTAVAVEAVA